MKRQITFTPFALIIMHSHIKKQQRYVFPLLLHDTFLINLYDINYEKTCSGRSRQGVPLTEHIELIFQPVPKAKSAPVA